MNPISRSFVTWLAAAAGFGSSFASGLATAQEYTLPSGFSVEKASDLQQSFIAVTFGPEYAETRERQIFLAVENGPILWARDHDQDGWFEDHGTFTAEVTNAQGLVWFQSCLFAVGSRNGEPGVFRITPSKDGQSANRIETLAPIKGAGEHGAHGIVAGPDGYLYLAIGNEAAIDTPPHPLSPLIYGNEASLLPPIYDPNGFNINARYPDGVIARIDPRNGSWIYHSVGYRNHYDLAFDARGELFTCDSDMEWDLGLPWYRPVRVLHCTSGSDYGSRAGTAMGRTYLPDSIPEVATIGRGSPTGVAFYGGTMFPEHLRGALIIGDWSRDKILAVRLTPRGASYSGEVETLIELKNSSGVTDVAVGSEGALYFTTGGRGALGELRRVEYRTPPEEPKAPGASEKIEPMEPGAPGAPLPTASTSTTPAAPKASAIAPDATAATETPSKSEPIVETQPNPERASDTSPKPEPPDAKPVAEPVAKASSTPGSGLDSCADDDAVRNATGDPLLILVSTHHLRMQIAATLALWGSTSPRHERSGAPAAVSPSKVDAPASPAAPAVAATDAAPKPAPAPRKIPVGRRASLDELKLMLSGTDPRAARRACEELVTLATLEPDVRDRLYALLGSPDPVLRQAARASLERTAAKDLLARLDDEHDPERILETVLLLARGRVLDVKSDALATHLRRLTATRWGAGNGTRIARVLEIVIINSGELSPDLQRQFSNKFMNRFPAGGPRFSRELAILLAHWNPRGAIDALVSALTAETDREQAIHYAYCLSAIESGWTADAARKFLAWFDGTAGWTGGASFAGYLDAMHRRFLQHLTPDVRREMVRESDLGASALCSLIVSSMSGKTVEPGEIATSPELTELFIVLKSAYEHLGDSAADVELKKSIMRALGGLRIRGAAVWMRSIAFSNAPEHAAAYIALARECRPADQPVFLRGLSSTDPEVPEACAEALCTIGQKPDKPDAWAAVLDAAYRLGTPRGWSVLQVAERWLGKPPLVVKPEDWAHTLQQFDAYFSLTYPSFERAPRPEAERPRWEHERILAFLQKSSARHGSPARGAEVFHKAACVNCHVFNPTAGSASDAPAGQGTPGTNAQWGPDLTTVARRSSVEQLLETIDYPSRAISDLYRTSVVEIGDEQRVDGRIVEQDDEKLTVLSADGSRRVLPRSEVKNITASAVSPMPEGLLSALTLEEIKDLFAYLASEGKIEEADAADGSWTPMFFGQQRLNWSYDANDWKLKSEVLIGSADRLPHSSWVMTKTSYRDFEIEFDVFLRNGNSGFQYRSKIDPEKPDPIGYQADIGQEYWGSLYATDGRDMLDAADPNVWKPAVNVLGWNHFHVEVRGDRHLIEINGVTTVDKIDGDHRSGAIGFQLHQGMKMEVRFANMRLHTIRPR